MAKQYKVLVNTGKAENNKTIDVQQHTGDKGQPARIKAQAGAKYQLQELGKNKNVAPDYVRAKRNGKNLEITFENGNSPDLIIEDYYSEMAPGYNGVIGQAENGGFYEYIPEDPKAQGLIPELADGARSTSVALGGAEVTPVGAAVAVAAFPMLGALGVLGAGAAAAYYVNKDTGNSTPIVGALASSSDTGALGDNRTSDSTPTLSGKVPAGATATVTIQGQTYPVTVLPDGSWTFTQPTNLPDGTYTPILNVTQNGVTTPTALTPFTIDTVTNVDITNPGRVGALDAISGTAEPGDSIVVKDANGNVIGTTTAGADGQWSLVPTSALPSGTLSATAADAAGNTATDTATPTPGSVQLPTAPITGALAPVSDNMPGTTPDDNKTNDATPVLAGTVPTGTLAANVVLEGQLYPATIHPDGSWSAPINKGNLPDGTYYPVLVTTGPTGAITQTNLQPFTIDTTPANVVVTSNATALAAGETAQITFTLSEAVTDFTASDVTVSGGTLSGFAQSATNPLVYTATFTPTPGSTPGTATISVGSQQFSDAAGNLNTDGAEANNSVSLATGATVTGSLAPASDSGVPGDDLTNDKTPTLQGKVPAGASADVTIDGVSYPVTVDPSGNWTFTQPNNLPDGTYTPVLHVKQGGQTSSTPLDPFTIDTVPASVVLSSNTSTLAPGQPATLTFTFSEVVNGFTAADLTVTGGAVTGLTQSPTDPKVWTATFTPAATGTVATVTLPSGKFSDAAGNLNTDGADPNNTLTLLTNASVTGQLSPASDNATGVPNDNKTSDPTPELIGKVPAGSTATVTLAGQTYPVIVNPDGSYSFTPPVGLPDGTYTPVLNVTTAGVTSATPITPFTIDTVAPTVEVTASRTNLAGGLTAQLTFTLSEASTDFSVADIQSTGGTLSGFAQSATNPLVYTATFTPTTGAMSGQVSVASTTFSDAAGNLNEDGADANNSVDFVLRSVQSGGYNPGASATGELAPTSDTGEKGDGITNDPTPTIEGKVPAGSTATITLAGQTYPVEVNPDGSYNFTPPAGLPDGTYTPALNVTTNGVTTATPITPFTIDTTPPTIAISADKTQLLAGQTALITFTLSEEVSDFAAADIAVSGGTLSGFAQSSTDPKVYTATFTPSANSSANSVIRVASGEFSDAANNFNADGADANNTLSIPTNTLANGATAFLAPSSDSGTPGDATTNDNTPTLTGSVPPGATATMSVAGQIYPVTVNPDGTYSFTLPTGLPDGTYTPQITVTPTGGGAPVTSPGTPFTIDTTAPTVAITSSATSLVTGQTAPITFTLSEASSDFTLADVSVTGGTLSGLVQSATDPKVYTATFTPAAGRTAPSVISVASFKFSDAAGNFNADGSDANNTLTLPTNTTGPDAVAPTIAITADRTQLLTGQTALVTFTLSEASSDFTAADVTVSGGALSGFAQSSTDPKVYTATFTPSANSTANSVISVASGKFSDAAGNQNADGADANNTLSLPTNTSAGLITGALDPSSDTGKPGDNATVDTTPTISGTAPAGATVQVRIPAQNGQPEQVLTATADPDGQYSVNVPTGLLDGTYTPQITVTPTNASPTTVQGTPFTIDTTPPTIAISASASTLAQGQTSTISFTLSEASSDFTLADVIVSGGTLSNFAGSGTSYSAIFTPHANSTANGVISVASSKFADAAGNQNADGSDANNTVTLTVNTFNVSSAAPDTTPPAKPTTPSSYADNTGTTQSPATTAPVTDDTTPALNIGNVPTGETPSLYVDGVKVPATYDPVTGTLTPNSPLTEGPHQLAYSLTDPAGNESQPSNALPVTIDSTAPAKPAAPTTYADNSAPVTNPASTAPSTNDTTPGLNIGAVPTGTTPSLYVDGVKVPATYDPATGTLTPTTPLTEGPHQLAYSLTDPAGNESQPSNALPLTVDTQAPAAPASAPASYADNSAPVTNPASTAPTTNDTTPGLNIGTVPTGTTPSLYVDGVKVPATYDPATGTLTPNSPLPEGPHQVSYSLTDAAGNESAPSPAMPLTVDATPPTIAVSTNQSTLAANQTATITFTLSEASSDFTFADITVSGGTLGALTQSSTDPKVYTATYTPLTNSTTPVTISVASSKFADAAGNQNADGSDTNNTVTLSVNTAVVGAPPDTTAPAQPTAPSSYADNTGPVTSPASTAPSTDDTTPGINIGNVPAGETPSLYVDGVKVPATYDPATGTLTPDTPLTPGAHQLTYTLTDAAGNESVPSAAIAVTIDSTPPTVIVTSSVGSSTPLGSGQTATITFTLSDAASDFTLADISVSGGTLGALTQSSTDPKVYTATYTPLANSTTPVTISVASSKFSDAAGNLNTDGADTNNSVTLTVDTQAPAAPSTAPGSYGDNTGAQQNPTSSAPATDDTTPSLNIGTVPTGTTPSLYVDGVKVPATYNPSTGTLTPNSPLPEGAHQITYTLTDAAGNESAPSPAMPLTVDTTPPTIAISTNQSSLVNGQTATITFTLSEASSNFVWDGTTGDITVTGGTLGAITQSSTNPLVYTATFTPTANSTANGVISVASTKFSDAAGNQNADGSDTNNTVTLSVNTLSVSTPSDTTPPTIAITSDKTTLGVDQTATITFTLSEASSDFTDADVQITGGGSLGTLVQSSTNPLVYTATYTPATNSTTPVTISVASDKFKDAAGNFNKDGADSDNSVPLSINTVPSSTNATATIDITSIVNTPLAAQSQDTGTSATDFITQDDTLVYKGTVTNWVAGLGDRVMLDLYDTSSSTPVKVGSTFVTPDSAGNWIWNDITNVRATGKYTLEATIVSSTGTTAINPAQPTTVNGNLTNGGYDQQVIVIDKGAANTDISLALSITTDANNNGTVGTTELAGASTFTSRATFDTTKAQAGDKLTFSATNGSTGLTDQTVTLSATDVSRGYVDVTFNKPNEGATQTVTVNYTDAAGNVATDTKPQDAASLDTTAPTIALSTSATTVGSGQGSNTATITFILSEASTNFDATDVAVTGGTLSNFAGSGTTYTATFTPTAGQTSGTVSVASSKFSDAGGNQNADGAESNNTQSLIINVAPVANTTSLSNTLTPSVSGPEVTITDNVSGAATNGQTITYTLKFSEAIDPASLTASDLSLTNGTLVANSLTQVDATTWTVQATAPASGVDNQALTVKAGSYSNSSGVVGSAGTGTQTYGVSIALTGPDIDGPVGQTAPTGWSSTSFTPDTSDYTLNGFAVGSTGTTYYANSNGQPTLNGVSTDGGQFASFLSIEGITRSITGLTVGQTYTYGVEWQKFSLGYVNGALYDGLSDLTINIGGVTRTYTSDSLNDPWTKAYFTFTATSTSMSVTLGSVDQVSGKSGFIAVDSLTSTDITVSGLNAGVSRTGTSGADTTSLIGADGNDSLVGGGGADVIAAGGGNDAITLNSSNVTALGTSGNGMLVDGGTGINRLVINDAAATLDLTNTTVLDKVRSINTIDIAGTGANTLKLDYRAVTQLATVADVGTTSANEGKMLAVNGNAGDTLQLAGTWTKGSTATSGTVLAATYGSAYGFVGTASYDTYTLGDATVFVPTTMTVSNSQTSTTAMPTPNSAAVTIESLFASTFSDSNTTTPINNFQGVAITSAGTTTDLTSKGKYQLSKDGGTTWIDVAAGLTDDTAIYAAKGDLIRFVGTSATATPQDLVVRLVDGYASSTLATGDTVDANPNGGMTAYSGNTVTLTITPTIDAAPPGIVVTSSASTVGSGQTATITFTLSEPSINFDASDVSVTGGGTLSNFQGSGTVYTATYTPASGTSNGSAVISVASGKFTDAAGNPNADGAEANNTVSISYDTLAPVFSSAATSAILEKQATTVVAYDATADSDTGVTYTLSGTDAALFDINPVNGQITFKASPSHATPLDSGANNVYDVTVTATDTAGNATNQNVAITVVPQPTLNLNVGAASGSFSATPTALGNDFRDVGPEIITTTDGGYVLTWRDEYSAEAYNTVYQKFNANHQPVGSKVIINNWGSGGEPSIAPTSDGGFVLVSGNGFQNLDVNRYDSSGTQVASTTLNPSNTYNVNPDITFLSDGGYVVTWTNLNDIYVQRFSSSNALFGSTKIIDGASTADREPAVVATPDGGYVVVWSTSPATNIYVQKFGSDNNPVGPEASLNNPNGGIDQAPDIAVLSDGSYVVAWEWWPNNGNGNIYVQKFNSDGTASGNMTTLSGTTGAVWDKTASITALSDGGYVVAWEGYVGGTGYTDVFIQRFDKNNATVGPMQQLQGSNNADSNPQVTATTDGGYVVVWDGIGTATNNDNIYIQKFGSDDKPVGDKRMIFGFGDGSGQNDSFPKVTATSGGGYVVAWQGSSGASYGTDVFVEAFDGAGVPAGSTAGTTGNFTITSSLTNVPTGQTVNDYVVTYPSGSLTVGGVSYASGASIAKATWDAAVTAKTILLTGASATNYSFTLVANVSDSTTGLSFPVVVNRMGTGLTSPLVIDLNGDGLQTLGLDQGVAFDLSGSGAPVQTGWVDRHDGLLAMDLNHDGLINSGAELFGNGTTLANGSKAADGWAALAGLDSNADGLIDARDAQFANLRVWRDADTDGVTDAGELLSLADAGIASISLAHDASVTAQNGNLLSGKAVVTHTDGSTTHVTDAWLATEDLHTVPVTIDLSQVIHGNLADLTNARAEVLQIKVNDVLQLPTTAAGQHQMEVLGDAADAVNLDSLLVNGQPTGTWSQAGAVAQNGHMFNVYQYSGDQSLQVLIDQHIAQSNVHLS